jgi:hypothetical protein
MPTDSQPPFQGGAVFYSVARQPGLASNQNEATHPRLGPTNLAILSLGPSILELHNPEVIKNWQETVRSPGGALLRCSRDDIRQFQPSEACNAKGQRSSAFWSGSDAGGGMRANNQDGHKFLAKLAGFPAKTFESKFSGTSTRLGLGTVLSGTDLTLLYRASFRAALCNIAFNGRGGCGGRIRPDRELNRVMLEREFMKARDALLASECWQSLPESKQDMLSRIFLNVSVAEENLAW